jgi:hypothetical protein
MDVFVIKDDILVSNYPSNHSLGGTFMAYQLTVTLTDQEYAALAAEAEKSGKQAEALLHEILMQRLQPSLAAKRPLTAHEFEEILYREGLIENIPTRQPLTSEEKAERERLAQVFAGGKPASEMVIEDRGPY